MAAYRADAPVPSASEPRLPRFFLPRLSDLEEPRARVLPSWGAPPPPPGLGRFHREPDCNDSGAMAAAESASLSDAPNPLLDVPGADGTRPPAATIAMAPPDISPVLDQISINLVA